MTAAHERTTLARLPKAFATDTSWYQSYWCDRPQPRPRKPSARFVQALVWGTVFVAGAYLVI
jgi:hypothetical protein